MTCVNVWLSALSGAVSRTRKRTREVVILPPPLVRAPRQTGLGQEGLRSVGGGVGIPGAGPSPAFQWRVGRRPEEAGGGPGRLAGPRAGCGSRPLRGARGSAPQPEARGLPRGCARSAVGARGLQTLEVRGCRGPSCARGRGGRGRQPTGLRPRSPRPADFASLATGRGVRLGGPGAPTELGGPA